MMEGFYEYAQVSTDKLIPYVNNARTHSDDQVNQIAASINEWGFSNPLLIDENNSIIAGHGRLLAANKLGIGVIPCIVMKGLSEVQKKAYILADNKLALNAGWDEEMLKLEIEAIKELDFDLDIIGFNEDELSDLLKEASNYGHYPALNGNLTSAFGFAPFSVLNTTKATWQDRKKYWMDLGLGRAGGREEGLAFGNSDMMQNVGESSTSIFDHVLCEILVRWFSPSNGLVLDPFAGGEVRGIVSAVSGREYIGIDLRPEQIEHNRAVADGVVLGDGKYPCWHVGNSLDINTILGADTKADMILSCPPYADLEVYSDDPKDLSNMAYDEFISVYSEIIKKTCDKLNDDSFVCWVVGEVRDKAGNYYNFVGETIKAFTDAGVSYYNEMILVNACGTLPLRAGKSMKASRKVGKHHQNVLIFVKGDGKKAASRCGDIDFPIEEESEYGEEL